MLTNTLAEAGRRYPHYSASPHGGHLAGQVAAAVLIYAAFHVLAGRAHHGAHRGRRGNIGWSLRRGPWVSWRVLGGTWYRRV